MARNPCLPKNSVSKVSTKMRGRPSLRARSISADTRAWPTPWPRTARSTATVRISARSSHNTCSAPHPTTSPSRSATQNSCTASYSVTRSFSRSTLPASASTRRLIAGTSAMRARRMIGDSTAQTLAGGLRRHADGLVVTLVGMSSADSAPARRVSLLTLGCSRNEVDSEELAGRLAAGGWELAGDPGESDVVVVNTCGFVESAKKDSVDTLLAASDTGAKVVAVGCMAERYGKELAENLPEADAVLGFDHYPQLAER